jgi:hypothetical protein
MNSVLYSFPSQKRTQQERERERERELLNAEISNEGEWPFSEMSPSLALRMTLAAHMKHNENIFPEI